MNQPAGKFLTSLGREITPELFKQTYAYYAPHALSPTPAVCTVTRDLSYGPDAKQQLDVFVPALRDENARPVVVFVHGGGFKYGDKGEADSPFYNNIGTWLAANHVIGVTMTYRLAPAHQWPSGSEDVAGAMRWLTSNIASYGGDPANIILIGQSAGAVHVAGYIADSRLHIGAARLAGAVMISGIYDLTRFPRNPFEDAYYGTDPDVMADRSTLRGLVQTDINCLYAVAELDSIGFQDQARLLVNARFEQRQQWPNFVYAFGHNHLSTVYDLGSENNRFGEQLLDFIRDAAGSV